MLGQGEPDCGPVLGQVGAWPNPWGRSSTDGRGVSGTTSAPALWLWPHSPGLPIWLGGLLSPVLAHGHLRSEQTTHAEPTPHPCSHPVANAVCFPTAVLTTGASATRSHEDHTGPLSAAWACPLFCMCAPLLTHLLFSLVARGLGPRGDSQELMGWLPLVPSCHSPISGLATLCPHHPDLSPIPRLISSHAHPTWSVARSSGECPGLVVRGVTAGWVSEQVPPRLPFSLSSSDITGAKRTPDGRPGQIDSHSRGRGRECRTTPCSDPVPQKLTGHLFGKPALASHRHSSQTLPRFLPYPSTCRLPGQPSSRGQWDPAPCRMRAADSQHLRHCSSRCGQMFSLVLWPEQQDRASKSRNVTKQPPSGWGGLMRGDVSASCRRLVLTATHGHPHCRHAPPATRPHG